MNGNRNIITVVSDLVGLMTPVINFTVSASGSDWKISTSNTYWLTRLMYVSIGGTEYQIKDLVQNDHFIISGIEPTVDSFQMQAPEFWHGSSRKVNNERSDKQDVRSYFVYLPKPVVTADKDYDSDKAYDADIRPVFLTNYDPQSDTIALQQEEIINPLHSMCDYFEALIESDLANFDDLENVPRNEWMNFGDSNVWGNDKLIFDENLSGIELRFTLPVLSNGCQVLEVNSCLDANETFNGNPVSSIPSGGSKAVIVQTNEAIPVQTGTVINDTPSELRVEVNAAVATPRTYVRPRTTGQTVSYNSAGVIVSPDDPSPIRDTAYRVAKKSIVDPYDPPQFGEPMLPRVDKNWRLTQDNVFGHDFLFTGTSGGYYDPDTALYYDIDGNTTTEALAFPNDLVVDHHTGFLWIRNAQGIKNWETHLTDAYNTTVGGFSEFYVPSQTELDSLLNIGTLLGYSGINPPFDFSTSNKIVSDTYLGNPAQQWYVSGISQRLTAPKGNNYRAMYFKPINPNTDL